MIRVGLGLCFWEEKVEDLDIGVLIVMVFSTSQLQLFCPTLLLDYRLLLDCSVRHEGAFSTQFSACYELKG